MTATPSDRPLLQVRTGIAKPLGPRGIASGIRKDPRDGPVYVGADGIEGDEQGDRVHHGGPEKAVHHYALEHYALWGRELPQAAALFAHAGLFGENFSTLGLDEHSVCIGDVFEVGAATLQVSQARQPCWRLDLRSAIPGLAAKVQASARTGWYYRVLEPGGVRAGDLLRLARRPNPAWPLSRLLHYLHAEPMDRAALQEMCAIEALSPSWRALARSRLERGRVEDWSARLTPPG
jgi:MOSC domain-containing protein YiiM